MAGVTLWLTGELMTGRGINQILPHLFIVSALQLQRSNNCAYDYLYNLSLRSLKSIT